MKHYSLNFIFRRLRRYYTSLTHWYVGMLGTCNQSGPIDKGSQLKGWLSEMNLFSVDIRLCIKVAMANMTLTCNS